VYPESIFSVKKAQQIDQKVGIVFITSNKQANPLLGAGESAALSQKAERKGCESLAADVLH
jgi:hypothetical protein